MCDAQSPRPDVDALSPGGQPVWRASPPAPTLTDLERTFHLLTEADISCAYDLEETDT